MLESTTFSANNDEEEPESESDDDNDAWKYPSKQGQTYYPFCETTFANNINVFEQIFSRRWIEKEIYHIKQQLVNFAFAIKSRRACTHIQNETQFAMLEMSKLIYYTFRQRLFVCCASYQIGDTACFFLCWKCQNFIPSPINVLTAVNKPWL